MARLRVREAWARLRMTVRRRFVCGYEGLPRSSTKLLVIGCAIRTAVGRKCGRHHDREGSIADCSAGTEKQMGVSVRDAQQSPLHDWTAGGSIIFIHGSCALRTWLG